MQNDSKYNKSIIYQRKDLAGKEIVVPSGYSLFVVKCENILKNLEKLIGLTINGCKNVPPGLPENLEELAFGYMDFKGKQDFPNSISIDNLNNIKVLNFNDCKNIPPSIIKKKSLGEVSFYTIDFKNDFDVFEKNNKKDCFFLRTGCSENIKKIKLTNCKNIPISNISTFPKSVEEIELINIDFDNDFISFLDFDSKNLLVVMLFKDLDKLKKLTLKCCKLSFVNRQWLNNFKAKGVQVKDWKSCS
jgi:hypothetical protein